MNVYAKLVLVFYLLFSCISSIYAYELGTHARLAEQAYNRSVLATQPVILENLSLSDLDLFNPLGTVYYVISGSSLDSRNAELFPIEKNRMPNADIEKFTFKGWLMRGVIREDDIPDYWPFLGENPQDDPDGKIPRVRNHFYDPVNRRPLEVAGVSVGMDAPTWATGSEEAFGCLNCEDLNRRNHFTVMDAREAMYRALTGQDKFGNTAIGPNGQQADESVRKACWATTFRALGDVLHLVQDMAQPQHTRNDIHTLINSFGVVAGSYVAIISL